MLSLNLNINILIVPNNKEMYQMQFFDGFNKIENKPILFANVEKKKILDYIERINKLKNISKINYADKINYKIYLSNFESMNNMITSFTNF